MPTDAELAAHLDLSAEALARTVKAARGTTLVSLEELLPTRAAKVLHWPIRSRTRRATSRVTSSTTKCAPSSSVRSSRFRRKSGSSSQLYYFEGQRLREIKAALGVSESRVSQIHSAAVARLKKMFRGT